MLGIKILFQGGMALVLSLSVFSSCASVSAQRSPAGGMGAPSTEVWRCECKAKMTRLCAKLLEESTRFLCSDGYFDISTAEQESDPKGLACQGYPPYGLGESLRLGTLTGCVRAFVALD